MVIYNAFCFLSRDSETKILLIKLLVKQEICILRNIVL